MGIFFNFKSHTIRKRFKNKKTKHETNVKKELDYKGVEKKATGLQGCREERKWLYIENKWNQRKKGKVLGILKNKEKFLLAKCSWEI